MIRYSSRFALILMIAAFFPLPVFAASYYTEGHADLGLGDDDQLELHVHCHGGSGGSVVDGALLAVGEEFDPAEVVVVVPISSKNYIQSQGGATSPATEQLGIAEGSNYWYLPQDEYTLDGGGSKELPSPHFGLGSEDMETGIFENDAITFKLISMAAPVGGQFGLSQLDQWHMSTYVNGIDENDKYADFPIPGHEHVQWYFTKPGVYHLTFEASATRVGGGPETDEAAFTFLVGTTVWTGTSGSNWNEGGNWLSGVPEYGSTVIFTNSSDPHQPLTQDIASPLDLHGVIFTANAGSYQLGGQTIRLSVDSPEITCESPNDQIIGNPLELAAGVTFAVNGLGNVTLSGAISGSGSLIKSGSGTLLLANTASYTDVTSVTEGILALDADGQINNSAIVNNATLQINAGTHTVNAITGTGLTEIISGSLTVTSISQGGLCIGSGAKLIIAPSSASPLSDTITTVPEPEIFSLLTMAFCCLLAYQISTKLSCLHKK